MAKFVPTGIAFPVHDYVTATGESIHMSAYARIEGGAIGSLDWVRVSREKRDYFGNVALAAALTLTGVGVAYAVGGAGSVAAVGVDTAMPAVAAEGSAVAAGSVASVGVETAAIGIDAMAWEFAAVDVAGASGVSSVAGASAASAGATAAGGYTVAQMAGAAQAALAGVAAVADQVSRADAAISRLQSPVTQSTTRPLSSNAQTLARTVNRSTASPDLAPIAAAGLLALLFLG